MSIIGDLFSNITNRNIANQNLQFQRENLDYQKQLQNTLFMREDNAVQRRAEDLEKAGFSKTLAAGSPAGAGQAISTSAPHNDMRWNMPFNVASEVLDLMQKKNVYDQNVYNLQYARAHGLPYGATPSMFSEVSAGIKAFLDKYLGGKGGEEGGSGSTSQSVVNAVTNAIDYFAPGEGAETPKEIITGILYPEVGGDKSPQGADTPRADRHWFNRNIIFDDEGKAVNPHRNPSAYR